MRTCPACATPASSAKRRAEEFIIFYIYELARRSRAVRSPKMIRMKCAGEFYGPLTVPPPRREARRVNCSAGQARIEPCSRTSSACVPAAITRGPCP